MADSEDRVRFCKCPKCLTDRFAIFKLLSAGQSERLVYPRLYLSASHEVFGFTLFVTWLITFLFFPDQIMQHPAKPIIGSFNPCFGWDYAPASYIVVVCCSTNVYLTWRYSFLEQTRTYMYPGSLTCSQRFAIFSSILLALSSHIWLLLWLIGPNGDDPNDEDGPVMVNWIAHTGIFTFYGLSSYLATLGNYLEVANGPYKQVIQTKNTAFVVVYGISLGYLICVYFYDLAMYEFGKEPAVLPFFTQLSDFLWMACVSSIATFLPVEPPLKITTELVTDDEEMNSIMGKQT